ncbi:hypothetical protein [Sphingomonas crusticola]|uniref:hypothetical protein n=1 Tax=Sphingomonas crusticola TaxID=1697973 RepID=UPI0013C340B3|nr:hypothetical protein [Sphingomonas crusticola]
MDIALPMSRDAIVERILGEVRRTYAGMPRAVREMRMVIRHWDGPSTVIVGESYGAFLAAIAAQARHRGTLVLLSPMLATYREIVAASLDGRHPLQALVAPPQLVFCDVDRTNEILDTPARRRQLLEVTSLVIMRHGRMPTWARSCAG